MKLIIQNPTQLDLTDFCEYLIDYFQNISVGQLNLNAKLISNWNRYLQVIFPEIEGINLPYIIGLFLDNQTYNSNQNSFFLEVNKNIKIEGIPLERLVQTIEAGALDIKRYPIFTNIYKRVADILPILYKNWRGG